jgi:hypothetical protein
MSGHSRVLPLELSGSSVRFRWETRPEHPAWARSEFTVSYDGGVDLAGMPRALLWSVFLGCTHPIWSMLDGYDVQFEDPVDPAELAFWTVMAAASRSASGLPSTAGAAPVRFRSSAVPVERLPPPRSCTGPPAALLSCGKESLLSLSLLREVTGEAVALSVDSSMPGTHDHESAFRAWALEAIARVPGIHVHRVRSDVRATWTNDHALTRGGIASLNELADCFVYPSVALPVAYQYRLPWVALGSEWGEHHMPVRIAEGWQFDRYFSLSGVAIAAVSALWTQRYGVGYTSVIQPISQYLVQRILLQRYPELAAFQHSCYRARPDVRACQVCEKCLRVTALALAAGTDPAIIGTDVRRVFSRWNATAVELEEGSADTHYASMNHLIRFALSRIDRRRADVFFKPRGLRDLVKLRPWRARRRLHRILSKVGVVPPDRLDTIKRGYLRYLPAELRDRIGAILESHAAYDGGEDGAVHAARAEVVAALTEPLRKAARVRG